MDFPSFGQPFDLLTLYERRACFRTEHREKQSCLSADDSSPALKQLCCAFSKSVFKKVLGRKAYQE